MNQELKTIESAGRTVDEAVGFGLAELGLQREDVEVEVLEEPNKGLFGLIGNRQAKVRLTEKITPDKIAVGFVKEVFENMGVKADIQVEGGDEQYHISFHGPELGILIGRRGDTLDALQYLVNLVVNRRTEKRIRFVLDVEEYRRRREETLVRLAQRLSDKVKRTRKHVVLEPMNPQERRVIHTALQNDPSVYTFSQGNEPYRKVVISPKK
ncbi:MAG: protein jag [Firmicutes bacterium]|nr:protein jag [Bacillota bacterium]